MDYLKIESKLITRLAGKVVERAIKKAYGINIKVCLNQMEVSVNGETATAHIDCKIDAQTEDLLKLLKD